MKKSRFCCNPSPVHVSDNMSGKMEGIPSISTSCLRNPFCLARMKKGDSVCSHCFAKATINHYSALGKALDNNFDLLTGRILNDDEIPIFKPSVEIVRIESFGDIANETQVINYLNIVKANPHCVFAWWTKNEKLLHKILLKTGKPENLVLIRSSEKLNQFIDKPISPFFDHVFTVYNVPERIADKNFINCGARNCNMCRRCYTIGNNEFFINEILK